MRTLGQERAEFALKKAINIPQDKKEKFEKFSAGAPSMILQNGFGQALAFWIAKSKSENSEHMIMFNLVKEWLCEQKFATGDTHAEFIKNISQMEQSQYLTAQKETLALLEWVKRYANAGL